VPDKLKTSKEEKAILDGKDETVKNLIISKNE
jgi:hypothetical protein